MDEPVGEKKMTPAEFFFHQLVGQDSSTDVVHLDHCYARLWNAHPDAAHARPAKMLFMKGIPHYPGVDTPSNEDSVDVEAVTVKQITPHDGVRGRALMNECERHVLMNYASDKSDDWEDHIKSYRSGWSVNENRLFNKVMKVLQSDRLSRLAYEGTQNEPVNRRLVVNKTASNIRQIFTSFGWDMQLLHWLHQVLLEHLSPMYLSAYLDVLQTLKSKVPSLIDKLVACSPNKTMQNNGESLQTLLKRPWDPVATLLSQHKPKKLPGAPFLILTPSGPQNNLLSNSRRMKFWQSQFSFLGRVMTVNSHVTTGSTVGQSLELVVNSVKNKVIELKVSHPNRPIILVGWTLGALIASQVALAEPVTSVVCLGFPLTGVDGSRGNLDDPLLDTQTPTLFVVGQNANTCSVDDIEDFRERMRAESGLVVVGGADDQLRVSHTKKKLEGMTQMMVDRCILNEIVEYLTAVLTEPGMQLPPLMADLAKVPEPKKRKRKQKEIPQELIVKPPKKNNVGRKAAQNLNASPSSPGSSTTETSSTGSSFGELSVSAKKTATRKRTKIPGATPKKKPRLSKTQDDGERQTTPKQQRQPGRQRRGVSNFSNLVLPEEPKAKESPSPFNLAESPKSSRSMSLNIGFLSSLGQFKQAQALSSTSSDNPVSPINVTQSVPKTSTPNLTSLLGSPSMGSNIPSSPIAAKPFSANNDNENPRKSLIQVVTMPGSSLAPRMISPVPQTPPHLQSLAFKGKSSSVTLPASTAAVSSSSSVLLNTGGLDHTTYFISSPKPAAGVSGGMLQSALLGNKPAPATRKVQVITFLKPASTSQEALSKMGGSPKKIAPRMSLPPGVIESGVSHSSTSLVEAPTIRFQPSPVSYSKLTNSGIGIAGNRAPASFTAATSISAAKDCTDLISAASNDTAKSSFTVECQLNELTAIPKEPELFVEETKVTEFHPPLDSTISDTLSHLSAGTQEAVLALTQLSAGAQMAVSALAELSSGSQRSPPTSTSKETS